MKQRIPLIALTALALALAFAGTAHAANEPRVMFVSKGDKQPVLIDLQGKQLPAQKGAVIPPGFTVMVPEGATVQIMTSEKSILAVRPNSLLRLDGVAGAADPYKLTLNRGGVRVANPELNFKKFEIDTPNAKVNFGKGDHETYFLMPGKLKDGRWGTFARGSKDETLVKTQSGDLKLMPREIGHVPGGDKSKPTIITLNEGGKQPQNPVSYTPGAREIGTTQMTENFQSMGGDPATGGSDTTTNARSTAPKSSDPVPGLTSYKTPDLSALTKLAADKTAPKLDVGKDKLQQVKTAAGTGTGGNIDVSREKKETVYVVVQTPSGPTLGSLDKLDFTFASKNEATEPIKVNLPAAEKAFSQSPPAQSSGGTSAIFTQRGVNPPPELQKQIEQVCSSRVCK